MKSSSATIGAFEAKTKLGELLERVSHGGEFTITKHDRPVARLIGFETDLTQKRAAATTALRTLRTRYTLQGLDVRTLREEGRA
jgi:prevent-host-death family protein